MTDLPLRQRAKLRRRSAIIRSAMRLFAERGFDATTIADIAEAAEVAPRSVSMYFPNKIDIALASTTASQTRLLDAVVHRAQGATFADMFSTWMRGEPAAVGDEEWAARSAMLASNPMLGGGSATLSAELLKEASSALASDLDVEPDDLAVRLALGLFSGVLLQFLLLPTATDAAASCDRAEVALTAALVPLASR